MQLLADVKMLVRLLNTADQIVDLCSKIYGNYVFTKHRNEKGKRTGLLLSSHSYSSQEFHNKRPISEIYQLLKLPVAGVKTDSDQLQLYVP